MPDPETRMEMERDFASEHPELDPYSLSENVDPSVLDTTSLTEPYDDPADFFASARQNQWADDQQADAAARADDWARSEAAAGVDSGAEASDSADGDVG